MYIFASFGFETKFLIQMSSITRVSYGQDGSDTNLSTPGFLITDACYAIHRNPRITIFVRHNRLDITVHHPLQTIIRSYTNKGSHDPVLIQQAAEINNSVAVGSIFRGTGNADEGR